MKILFPLIKVVNNLPISESILFTFNGISSADYGLYNVSMNDGMREEPFLSDRKLIETPIRGKDVPYFGGIELSPLEFNLTFAFPESFSAFAKGILIFTGIPVAGQTVTIGSDIYEFCVSSPGSGHIGVVLGSVFTADNAVTVLTTEINAHSTVVKAFSDIYADTVIITAITIGTSGNSIVTTETCSNAAWKESTLTGGITSVGNLRNIAKWLTTDFYCPLIFESNPNVVYYAMCTNAPKITHLADNGYLTINFRCNGPYGYGSLITTSEYDLSSNGGGGTEIVLDNNGDMNIYPIFIVTMVSGATFRIVNKTDSNTEMEFITISNAEVLAIDNENKNISTSAALTYRYDNMTGDFLRMLIGSNAFQVYGNVKIQFKYEYIYLA